MADQRSPPDTKLELLFAVKQTNLPELERRLLEVSDPDSPSYGAHLSNDAVHSLIAPSQASIDIVRGFLEGHGVQALPVTPNGDFLRATVSVAQAEALLGCEYFLMQHGPSGQQAHRTRAYSLPATVAAVVDFVSPTVHLPPPPRKLRKLPTPTVDAPLFGNSPKHLRELYSVDAEGLAPSNKMAVTAFIGQKYSKADLHEFWGLFCSGIHCGKGDPALVGDATTGVLSGTESMLDIESITGVAGNVTAEFWGFAGKSSDNAANEPFMKWLAAVSNTSDADVPKIFSTSYGEDEDSWSLAAATRMNVEFQKAGTRGISLLYASGDEGANCKEGKFVSETPGSSPWVTAVGGTTGTKEEAIGLSSGGFSSRWAMPDYQSTAVKAYLSSAKGLPPASVGYNTSFRAYPDISAQASGFTVVTNRIPEPGVAGTSCASPTAAGVIALLNDARLQAGKSTLGFLNPWIYKNMAKWNDITAGASSGCDLGDGWPAAAGWDAVTGAGTPNYKQLLTTGDDTAA